MSKNKMLRTGVVGTLIAAVCCFTPLLVVILGALGFSAVIGYLDYVLLPMLGVSILLIVISLWNRWKNTKKDAA
ncbi:MAG: mercury resistance system transport protein MerF [Rhizobiales bacterium]|nr:mercury resistance system transport protein MerF [Hyphomicrobiales bacterium]